eukprot:13198309-Alexandrium_andersonii.AAC.1
MPGCVHCAAAPPPSREWGVLPVGRDPAPRHDHVHGGLKEGESPAQTNKGWERSGPTGSAARPGRGW